MSLRAFHVVFIVVSIALTVVVAAWGVQRYVVADEIGPLTVAALAVASGAALVVYGSRFFKKLQELR